MIFHSFQVLSNLDSRVDAADQRMTNDVPCSYAGDFMGLMMCLALGRSRKSDVADVTPEVVAYLLSSSF